MNRLPMEPAADLEFLPIFRDEALTRLETFVETLRVIDPDEPSVAAVDVLRREAHTIKGAAGMVGMADVHQLAHALEDVCRSAQEDGGALGEELVQILGEAADALRMAIEGDDHEPAGTHRPHLHAVPSVNGNGNGHVEIAETTVLVVDDSFTLRELQRRILEKAGYRVLLAEDGRDGLDTLAANEEVELLVTDIDMPELDGFELVAAVRGDGRWDDLPVIIVTSRDADEDRRRGISLGADEYVVKGAFHEQILLETVARLSARSVRA